MMTTMMMAVQCVRMNVLGGDRCGAADGLMLMLMLMLTVAVAVETDACGTQTLAGISANPNADGRKE